MYRTVWWMTRGQFDNFLFNLCYHGKRQGKSRLQLEFGCSNRFYFFFFFLHDNQLFLSPFYIIILIGHSTILFYSKDMANPPPPPPGKK